MTPQEAQSEMDRVRGRAKALLNDPSNGPTCRRAAKMALVYADEADGNGEQREQMEAEAWSYLLGAEAWEGYR